MTNIERIRAMRAEELAKWLIEDVEQGQDFSTAVCDMRYCAVLASTPIGEDCKCTGEDHLAAAVRYLESEVEK